MHDFEFYNLLLNYSQNALILAGLLFVATFILEDLATTFAALLALTGKISVELALTSVISGIILGDIALYALGYSASKVQWLQNKIKGRFIEGAKDIVGKHVVATTLTARFIPGARLPSYLCLGYFKLNFKAFLYTVLFGVSLWTILLFSLFFIMGETAKEFITMYQHYAIFAALIIGLIVPRVISHLVNKIVQLFNKDESQK